MILVAPLAGTVRDLAAVPDPVFAERLMGDGVAIEPLVAESLTAVAPCDGVVVKLFPGGHAIVIDGGSGPILVHLGIDTVELHGEGLHALVREGSRVGAGTPLVEIQAAALRARGVNLISPIVGIERQVARLIAPIGDTVTSGAPLFEILPPSS